MNNRTYLILFSLATIVYIIGLNIPVMDVDSAQYASISREMAETGDFLQVKHGGEDYLDKPPLLFWIAALFFNIFGVYTWSFKIGAFLFTLLGVSSTYRLGRLLYNADTGRLAALILYSSQAFFLFNNDVRTDTALTGSVIFAIWCLVEWLGKKSWKWLIGGAVGIGLAMLAKGPIGLMVPVLAIAGYIVGRQSWRDFFHWQYLVLLLIVALILSPMLYGLYQQFDAQPEKTTMMVSPEGLKPEKGVSGVKFYLWTQSFGRITGENVWKDDSGPFFFVHNFLWSFLPWSFLFIFALFTRLRQSWYDLIWAGRTPELLTTIGFLLPFLAFSMSSYKLPHYIFVLYPLASILVAWWWNEKVYGQSIHRPWLSTALIIQLMIAIASIAVLYLVLFRFFPSAPWWVFAFIIAGIVASAWFFIGGMKYRSHIIAASVLVSLTVNFTLNAWFYPRVLEYQAGSQIAGKVREMGVDTSRLHYYHTFFYSMGFYLNGIYKHIKPEDIRAELSSGPIYLVTDKEHLEPLLSEYKGELVEEIRTFQVTRMSFNVLMEDKRKDHLKSFFLVRLDDINENSPPGYEGEE